LYRYPLGVTNQDQVVVYDGAGLFSAARAWWMFKVFGHEAVAVLDGGMPAWEKARGPMDDAPVAADIVAAAATAAAASDLPPPTYAVGLCRLNQVVP
jgi:thiosulfate/3-mercaptopyruvate sulfurtransferase